MPPALTKVEIKAPLPGVMPSRRERQKADRRERIYRAAMELFATKGYGETTIQEITDRADLGKGTFFNYFDGKEAILVEYYRKVTGEFLGYARTLKAPTFRKRIAALMRFSSDTAEREGALFELLIREIFASPALLQLDVQTYQEILGLYIRFIEEGKQAGELRPDLDAAIAARVLAGIYNLTCLEWVFLGKAFSMADMMMKKFDLVLNGMMKR